MRKRDDSDLWELEGQLLGALICDEWQNLPAVETILNGGAAFSLEAHRAIYHVGVEKGRAANAGVIYGCLGSRLDSINGAVGLGNYLKAGEHVGSEALVEMARQIAEAARRRALRAALSDALSAFNKGESTDAALAKLQIGLESVEAMRGPSRLLSNIVTGDQLEGEVFGPVRWVVPGILPEGLTILAGKPKAGKSRLALSIAAATACGGYAIGNVLVEQGRVLYLGLEDSKRRLQRRLRCLMRGDPIPKALELAPMGEWKRLDEGGLEAVRLWLQSHPDARLVVIDTLAKFRPRQKYQRKTDIYADDYEALEGLVDLANRFNVGIILVTHLRKMSGDDVIDEVIGSSGITGSADTVMVLRRSRTSGEGELIVRGRDIEDDIEAALVADQEIGSWRLVGTLEERRLSSDRQQILEVLRQAGRPMTPNEVAPLIEKSSGATRKLLWTMAKAGEIGTDSRGQYETRR